MLTPYLLAASRLLLNGVPGAHIDEVARRHGLPMGPFRLMDEGGLDVGVEVQQTLHSAFGNRYQASHLLSDMVQRGWLGKKSGVGFYRHRGSQASWNDELKISQNSKNESSAKLSAEQIVHALEVQRAYHW